MRGRQPRPVQEGHKWCPGCETELPKSTFGSNAARYDGLQPHCRTCKNASKWSQYNPARGQDPEVSARLVEYQRQWRRDNPDKAREQRRRYYAKHRAKNIARKAVLHAVINGELTRQPCEICGVDENIHAHHDSYEPDQYLNVRWLCHKHHMELHRRH
jgi:hypothetical protein